MRYDNLILPNKSLPRLKLYLLKKVIEELGEISSLEAYNILLCFSEKSDFLSQWKKIPEGVGKDGRLIHRFSFLNKFQ